MGQYLAYGYRPVRGAVDAVKEVHRLICRGYTDVVDADGLTASMRESVASSTSSGVVVPPR